MVKITDVARRAGVSPSTVSYALSGKRPISDATRRRVEAAVRDLGYRPHGGARTAAGGRPNVLALAAPLRPGVHVPVVMRLAESVVTTARAHDHDVLLLTRAEAEEGLSRALATASVDGLLLTDVGLHDPRLPRLRFPGSPSVLIGVPANPQGLTCVDLDFRAAGEACVNHLAGLGHHTVALVGSPPEVYLRETAYAHHLMQGFATAAARHGLTTSVHPGDPDPATAPRLAERLLREHPALTAAVIHNEPLLGPLITAFEHLGLRVPADLSVTALCPDDLAVTPRVPVTSVSLPADELGTRAVELLMRKLHGVPVPETTLLPPRLTERSSTRRA
ncbi:LacI family DNA-binding transcriptional regulator [Streptomyces cahuitamycinicus]|uniref:LacI family transcriptional regulator n=1 Tax=Streptomyces cahuitamycinicus TaxID=2070367 RepID=A0A2N8TNZ6_9ACTN|nr:LacI family DNA-binding transcriptional regulator [Streptomyces cahuitamycinicus]PNG20747.1 LacI family transcriptional regulator [Streptomyces cahuitamycinicus]